MVQRIGIESKRAFHNQRGLGNFNRGMITLLTQYAPENQYYLFAKPTPEYSFPHTHTIEPKGIYHYIPSLWRSLRCVKDIQAQSINLFMGTSGELPLGIEKIKGLKKVVVVHDLICLRFPRLYNWFYRHLFITKMRYACSVADIVIAISEQTKQDIIHFYGTSADKIKVLYQNCHPQFRRSIIEEEVKDVKERLHLPDEYILIVGAIEERKNILRLIEAIQLAQITIPLVVVGNGSQKYINKVRLFAERCSVDVRVLTNTRFSDFPTIYRGARVFVYPSMFEGFGIPILEALCVGVPIITSCGGCFAEVGGEAAEYINPLDSTSIAEGLQKVLNDDGLREQMIECGLHQAQKFTDEKVAENLLRILELK